MELINKKGNIGNIQGFVLAIVGVAVTLAIGLIVLSQLQSGQGTVGCSTGGYTINTTVNCYDGANTSLTSTQLILGNNAYNSTGAIITQLATVPTWIGILITVALAFIVLSYFYGGNAR